MLLKRAVISGFGKLKDVELSFESGNNIFCKENGYGKSTLAAFLCAMFYGMPSAGSRSRLSEAERRKYMPWASDSYGGMIEFSVSGQDYRVERMFGKKESEDTFLLYRLPSGLPSSEYSKNLGCELFSLDREAFLRTILFRPGKMEDGGLNDSLAKRLSGALEGEDTNGYQTAFSILDEARKSYIPDRQKEEKGERAKLTNELLGIEREMSLLSKEESASVPQDNLKERILSEIAKAEEAQSLFYEEKSLYPTAEKKSRLSFLDDCFGNGIPEKEKLKKALSIEKENKYNERSFFEKQKENKEKIQKERSRGTKTVLLGTFFLVLAFLCLFLFRKSSGIRTVTFWLNLILSGSFLFSGIFRFRAQSREQEQERQSAFLLECRKEEENRAFRELEKYQSLISPGCSREEALSQLLFTIEEYERLSEEESRYLLCHKKREELLQGGKKLLAEAHMECEDTLTGLRQLLQRAEEKKQAAEEKKTRLFDLTEQKDFYEKELLKKDREHYYITEALRLLSNAKESFSNRYMGKLREHLQRHLKKLSETIPEELQLDNELMLRVSEKGMLRELAYYSTGSQDLFGLCLRFALVDTLFPDEKPFLLLDDPFVNLDTVHLKKAMDTVKEIAEEYQVIYLTCHESRT